jgi:toxin YoeB
MEIIYNQKALDDLEFWKQSGNTKIQKKISELIEAIELNPFIGIGKPEALKYELTGKWSRRINQEHRIIYTADAEIIKIYSLKDHY